MIISRTFSTFFSLLVVTMVFGLAAFAPVAKANAADPESARTRIHADGRRSPTECVIRVSNPNGLYEFKNYKGASFEQKVKAESSGDKGATAVTVTVRVPARLPEMPEVYEGAEGPELPKRVARFAKASPRIQSNNPEIKRLAKEILKTASAAQSQEGGELTRQTAVNAVLQWVRENIVYSNEHPRELTDALTALERRSAHAIGYTHLTAALLRNLGIPTRIVRTFHVTADGGGPARFARHSLVEVYYPEAKQWVLLSPQLKVPVSPLNIYLYSARDWDQERHDACKPTSTDPKTRVEILEAR